MATRRNKNRTNSFRNFLIVLAMICFCILIIDHFKNNILVYFGFKHKITQAEILDARDTAKRNRQIIAHHADKIFGVDVSEYQENIDWEALNFIIKDAPINFVFIRATVGDDRVDSKFLKNWQLADERFIRGAYHYYRPNENSLNQANLFIKTVKLQKGDLPPVLDIEKLPKKQSIDSLKVGLKRWLNRVEAHYGVKPIIYSGDKYYADFLASEFSDYTFWIAHYNFFEDEINPKWQFWQFTEQAKVRGISGKVDLNIFNGDIDDLKNLTLP